jgi:hypothetical protein
LVTKYLARDLGEWPNTNGGSERRHDYFGVVGPAETGRCCESWRFPVVEEHFDPALSPEERMEWNEVTFIYAAERDASVLPKVLVVGLPESAVDAVPLEPVEDSCYLAATLLLRAARAYRYGFVVNGKVQPDPLNPHRERLNNGEEVSVVFTHGCFEPVVLERWELTLLKRISNHILPFNSREDELFQINPGSGPGKALAPQLHKLDHAVGVANYIDKLLAREERQHLPAYKNCLGQINRILRERNPYLEPRDMPESIYVQLYSEMASGNVPGWNYQAYGSPSYFLFLLRRHVWTGAFSHPKHGGNANAAGWLWLADSFPFDFGATQEPPVGRDPIYRG